MADIRKKRVVAFIGHNGSGKTTLAESILFLNKAIDRMGSVEQGNTTMDFDPVEIEKKSSVNASVFTFNRGDYAFTLIDTPGFSDFIGEVISTTLVSENVCAVLDASSGVEVQTEKTWRIAQGYKRPMSAFINAMDKEHADFSKAIEQLKTLSGKSVVALTIPIGSGASFKGVVNVIKQKAYIYENGKAVEKDIPQDMKEEVEKYRTSFVEAVVEMDDELMEKYFADEPVSVEELEEALTKGYSQGDIVPVFAGAATMGIGVNEFLDALQEFGASPMDVVNVVGGKEIKPETDAPFLALVFKVVVDPFIGKVTYAKVLRGKISAGDTIYNGVSKATERINHLYVPNAKNQKEVKEISVGDIASIPKLKESKIGEFLCDPSDVFTVEGNVFDFPEPMISKSVKAKNKGEIDKVTSGLSRLAESDPTFHMDFNPETGEIVASGIGTMHIDVIIEKLKKNFNVEVELGKPKIAYRETITKKSQAEYKHKKQSGGHGQYGHVKIYLEPLPRGKGFEFEDKIFGGAIPKNYIPSVEKGLHEAMKSGVLAGYPVDDIKVILYDGSYHEVDSSDIAFQIAAIQAFKLGMQAGNPTLLEPVMSVEIFVPDDNTGDVMGDLNSRRGRIQGMEPQGNGYQLIRAEVPLAEMLEFSSQLNSITSGKGYFTMKFSHYDEVPRNLQEKIIQERKAELEEESNK